MDFFGAEIKSGQTLAVPAQEGRVLHLSQVVLGEVTGDAKKDKGNEYVYLYLKFDGQKFVLSTLSHDKFPQLSYDLLFEKDFELSHNWKNGSVYVFGYYALQALPEYDSGSEDDLALVEDKPKANAEKTNNSEPAAKRVQIVEQKKDEEANGDDEDDSSDESDDDDSSDESDDKVEGLLFKNESAEDSDSDEEESDDETSDEDQETPVKAEPSKKRAAEPSTPVPGKKAKVEDTPAKADGKKVGGHVATPHPSKQAGKTAGNSGQANQTPKSAGSHACNSCGRKFGSDHALQSHSKAKHSGVA